MSHYVWSEVRARAVQLFRGERPRAETEQAIIDAFEREPRRVAEAVDQIGQQVERGKVRSGWEVLRVHLTRSDDNVRELVVSDKSDRARRVALAETRIRDVCCHFDRAGEMERELFGERGLLHPWESDSALREQMLGLWHEQRPVGEQIEAEQEARLRRYRDQRRELAAKPEAEQ